jgi:hypothetical protein
MFKERPRSSRLPMQTLKRGFGSEQEWRHSCKDPVGYADQSDDAAQKKHDNYQTSYCLIHLSHLLSLVLLPAFGRRDD